MNRDGKHYHDNFDETRAGDRKRHPRAGRRRLRSVYEFVQEYMDGCVEFGAHWFR